MLALCSKRLSNIGRAVLGNAGGARSSRLEQSQAPRASCVSKHRAPYNSQAFATPLAFPNTARPMFTQAPATQTPKCRLLDFRSSVEDKKCRGRQITKGQNFRYKVSAK